MIRRILFFALLFIIPVSAGVAHPGIGIVRDSKGNIFYTDLQQVWRITPDDTRTIVVPNVHTHELLLNSRDHLFGEHLWYRGDTADRWMHRVWVWSPDGMVRDVIPPRTGFREDHKDFFFVADSLGAMYWADRAKTTAIRKRTPDGRINTVVRAGFKDVRSMTVTPGGTVFLIDLHDLVRISPDGAVRTIAEDLAGQGGLPKAKKDRHAVMGLCVDQKGNAFVAIPALRAVKTITPDGHVKIAARSSFPWSPSGVLCVPDGTLWILEFSTTNAVRVRRISPTGAVTTFG